MSIQVGANDGQTIDINLQKIDSSTLGLSGFNVQASSTLKTTAITSSFADSGTAIGAVDVSGLGAGAAASAAQFDDVTGKYYTTISGSATGSENGVYELTAAAGSSTLGTQVGSLPAGTRAVTQTQTGTAINTTAAAATLVGAGVTGATAANTSLVKVSATDSQGNVSDAGYAVSYNGKLYQTDYNGADNTTVNVNTVKYTDSTGTTATGAIELGGVDKQTAVVTVGGKAYAADQVSGHDFKSGSALTPVATTATTDPLEKLDQAIAQIDKFRSSLGAVQNRLDSAVTNLNNTTTNLSEAQSRIQDADYATEVSNMSKAQIIQQAGNSVLAKANQVPQQVLSLLQG